MNQPYSTPRSFHPNAPPPHSSSIPPHQHALPAQTVSQQRQEQQIQENISQQSHPTAHQNHIHNAIPSEEQHAAVLTLQSFPNSTIFSCLQDFRSSLRHQIAFDPIPLSHQQYQAFLALTGCSDELVSKWLNCARFPGSLASLQNSYDSSTLGNGIVAASFLTQSPSLVSIASTRNTLSSPSVQGSYNVSRDSSVGLSNSSTASSNEHDRWCFYCWCCENCTQSVRTADGFKRHLREHFTRYYCIPQEPLVLREDGPRCASCNIPNPDPLHLNTHVVTGCVGRNFIRRYQLTNHLKTKHNVHDRSELAGHFEYKVDLKYFACGFCVCCCDSLIELANHVDAHHYKLSQHIRDWDNENVIRGLLSQPFVIEHWQAILASNPPLQEPLLLWMRTLVEQLKDRLKMSWKPAETLRNAAIDARDYPRNGYGYLEPVSPNQRMVANQTIEPFERQDAISLLSFTSEHGHGAYPSHTAAASHQLQHLARDRDRPNYMDFDNGQRYPQTTPETYGSPGSPVYGQPPYHAQTFPPSNWNKSFMQGQHLAYLSSPASASGTSWASEGQARNLYHPRLGGHSSGLSPNLITNAQSAHEVETYTTPAQAPAGWKYSASAMEAASSALSSDHNISPQSRFNDTYSSRVHPPLALHSSRQEPAHGRVIDMDSDSDDQQRWTQARGRSRRQRRHH